MERLLYSSSPTPLKVHLKSSSFVPRLGRIDSPSLGFLLPTRPKSRRVSSLSCKNENPSPSSSCTSSPLNNSPALSSSRAGLPNGSVPKPHFLKQIEGEASEKRKVWSSGLWFVWKLFCYGFSFVGFSFMIENYHLLRFFVVVLCQFHGSWWETICWWVVWLLGKREEKREENLKSSSHFLFFFLWILRNSWEHKR